MNEKWFSLEISEIEKKLNTNAASGLSRKAARSRLRKNGHNSFFFLSEKSITECVKHVLGDPMLLLVVAVNIIAAVFGRTATAICSGIMILLNISAAIFTYVKSCRISESMAEYSQPKLTVIRDGKLFYADARALVRGDVILVGAGDILPCDARIVACSSLKVSEYSCDTNGEESVAYKSADKLYPKDMPIKPAECENTLFAGSYVISGEARAIVVETGKYTYAGALEGGIALNDSADSLPALASLKKISRIYSFIILALILPLTVIGIFTFGSESLLDTFMMVMALSVSSLGELIYVIGGITVSAGLTELATESVKNNSAIVKNIKSLDKLARPDYLFLMGDAALTDGSYRVCRVMVGENEYYGEQLFVPEASRLAEYMMLIEYARAVSPSSSMNDRRPLQEALTMYGKRIGVDTESFKFKVHSALYFPEQNGVEAASISMLGAKISLFSSKEIDLIDKCMFIRSSGGAVPFPPSAKSELKKRIADMAKEGIAFLLCASSESPQTGRPICYGATLEGVNFFVKFRLPNVASYRKSIVDSGIKILLFTDDKSKSASVQSMKLLALSDPTEITFASKVGDRAESIAENVKDCGLYVGFSKKEIEKLALILTGKGKTVEAVGLGAEDLQVLECADVSVSYGVSAYKTSGVDFSMLESPVDSGKEYSSDGSQILRFTSDALVKRANSRGGGLGGIYNTTRIARGIHSNLETILIYLICSQAARAIIAGIVSVLSGISLLTAPQLLFGGLLLDFCAALVCAFDSHGFSGNSDIDFSVKKILSKLKRPLICMSLASAATAVCAVILGIITQSDVSRAVFASVSFMQLISVFLMRKDKKVKNLFSPIAIAFVGVFAFTTALFSAIPSLATLFGASPSSFASFLLVPVAPLAFFLLYFLICMKKARK